MFAFSKDMDREDQFNAIREYLFPTNNEDSSFLEIDMRDSTYYKIIHLQVLMFIATELNRLNDILSPR